MACAAFYRQRLSRHKVAGIGEHIAERMRQAVSTRAILIGQVTMNALGCCWQRPVIDGAQVFVRAQIGSQVAPEIFIITNSDNDLTIFPATVQHTFVVLVHFVIVYQGGDH